MLHFMLYEYSCIPAHKFFWKNLSNSNSLTNTLNVTMQMWDFYQSNTILGNEKVIENLLINICMYEANYAKSHNHLNCRVPLTPEIITLLMSRDIFRIILSLDNYAKVKSKNFFCMSIFSMTHLLSISCSCFTIHV